MTVLSKIGMAIVIVMVTVMLSAVIADVIYLPEQREAFDYDYVILPEGDSIPAWEDDIRNPDNEEYVNEVAFNLDIDPSEVTQEQFENRYLK